MRKGTFFSREIPIWFLFGTLFGLILARAMDRIRWRRALGMPEVRRARAVVREHGHAATD